MNFQKLCIALIIIIFSYTNIGAQDQPPVQRDYMIISELLPGTYNNTEQVYFNKRLNIDTDMQHQNMHSEIRKVKIKNLNNAFFVLNTYNNKRLSEPKILTLEIDVDTNLVKMKTYLFRSNIVNKYRDALSSPKRLKNIKLKDLTTDSSCDLYWRQIIHGYHATPKDHSCHVMIDKIMFHEHNEMMLDDRSLWISSHLKDMDHTKRKKVYMPPYKLLRARWFSCIMDFSEEKEGYESFFSKKIHDQGGTFFTPRPTQEEPGREIGIKLRNVDWAMNNTISGFTNDVFVMYVVEKVGAKEKNLTYTWGAPEEQSVGMNLKWLLTSCYIKPMNETRPYLRKKPGGPWESLSPDSHN